MKATTHVTKSGKAKCLAYRNGKRCGRVAKCIVLHKDSAGNVGPMAACSECSEGNEVLKSSPKGFAVSVSTFGPVSREYNAI